MRLEARLDSSVLTESESWRGSNNDFKDPQIILYVHTMFIGLDGCDGGKEPSPRTPGVDWDWI